MAIEIKNLKTNMTNLSLSLLARFDLLTLALFRRQRSQCRYLPPVPVPRSAKKKKKNITMNLQESNWLPQVFAGQAC